jgi:1-acyl-sn-glycerol-3-phosphate acyltransferase
MELVREAKLGAPAPSAERAVAPDGERLPLFYGPLRAAMRRLLEGLFDLEAPGLERLPAEGAYIVAANHHNYLDGIVLGAVLPRPISFLVMPRVYHATPLHPLVHRWAGSIPLNLERPDAGAIRRALGLLERGRVVGIFPEGPFSVCGRLGRGHPGVALLALRSGAPVVPIGIQGTYQALVGRRLYVPRRHPLRVRIGAPRTFAPARQAGDKATREEVTRRIMADIAALLS